MKKDSFVIARLLPFLALVCVTLLLALPLLRATGPSPVNPVYTLPNGTLASPTNFFTTNGILTTNAPIPATQLQGTVTNVVNAPSVTGGTVTGTTVSAGTYSGTGTNAFDASGAAASAQAYAIQRANQTGTQAASTITGLSAAATNSAAYQGPITLITSGTSGAATLSGSNTLNIPNYSGGVTSVGGVTGSVTLTGSNSIGVTTVNGTITIAYNGTAYTLPTATTSVLGGVKPDGTTITITGTGVISATSQFTALTGSITSTGTGGASSFTNGTTGTGSVVLSAPINAPGSVSTLDLKTFLVSNYGAKGDTRVLSDGNYTSGSATLTSTSGAFTAADVGKYITLPRTGTNPVLYTVSTVTNSSTLTMSGTAIATSSGTGTVYLGTDDTAAVQSALNAWASAGYNGTVVFNHGIYMIAGAASGANNAVLNIPSSSTAGFQCALRIKGQGSYAYAPTNTPMPVPLSGTILYFPNQSLASTTTRTISGTYTNYSATIINSTGTFTSADVGARVTVAAIPVANTIVSVSGTSAVLSCNMPASSTTGTMTIDMAPSAFATVPFNYSGNSYGFSGTTLNASDITIRQPGKPVLTGFQWYKGGGLVLNNCAFDIDLPLFTSTLPNPSSGFAYSVISPTLNNSAWSQIDGMYATGYYCALSSGEHMNANQLLFDMDYKGIEITKSLHNQNFGRVCIQRTVQPVDATSSLFSPYFGTPIFMSELDIERSNGASWEPSWTSPSANDVLDGTPNCYGMIGSVTVIKSNTGPVSPAISGWNFFDALNKKLTQNNSVIAINYGPGFAFNAGSTAGDIRCLPSMQGIWKKDIMVSFEYGFQGNASYTFPINFINKPIVTLNSDAAAVTYTLTGTLGAYTGINFTSTSAIPSSGNGSNAPNGASAEVSGY